MFEIIFHVDVNSAFLSWEAAYRIHHLGGVLDIREIPSAICGDISMRHGIILAKSMPAKKFGIQTGMTVVEAKQKCPELYMAPPNYWLYQKCSKSFLDILREYTPQVEVYSIDEAFMDMSDTIKLFGEPVSTAHSIKDRIEKELGFTVNIGVSSNKLLAKMAGDLKKPNMVHSLFPEEMKEKMWPLPVSDLFFVGRATTKKLFNLGIKTIGQLAATDPALLKSNFKKHGEVIWAFANGIDYSGVEDTPPPQKGYGNSTTISFDVCDPEQAKLILLALSETVAARLRKHDVRAEIISIGIKSCDFSYASHQMILNNPTNITIELYKYACCLFEQLWDKKTPIRHLGIHTSRLKEHMNIRQLNLFDNTDYIRLEKLDKTIDGIRSKYGIDSVKRAAFIASPFDHMEGGISREKRSVDYSKIMIR